MEIRFDNKMIEVIEGTHVYVDDNILTSWDYLSSEVQNRMRTLADSIREHARELKALIEETPTDDGELDMMRLIKRQCTNEEFDQMIADEVVEVI